jgi:flavin-dependent dehydrogenase
MQSSTDILVIGGGPAGSTAATLLAREGFSVKVLEREVFPREHIGESLLASAVRIFDLLGVRDKVESVGFVRKYGGYFAWREDSWETKWGDPATGGQYGFQVVRSQLDHILLEHSKSSGASVSQPYEVTELEFDDERPKAALWRERGTGNTGRISFRYLIDASGRAGIMTTKYLKNRRFNESFQNVAVWGYWRGFKLPNIGPSGAILILGIPDGWFWVIPLHNGTLSVGIVMNKNAFAAKRRKGASLQEIYHSEIATFPMVAEILAKAELVTGLQTEQDFSYISEECGGPGYFIAGDAACFLDPLLSTGFHLATYSAVMAAACIASISRNEVDEKEALEAYSIAYRQAYLRYMVLVATLYQNWFGKESLFQEAQRMSQLNVSSGEFISAFNNIISGVEDMQDMGDGRIRFVFSEMNRMTETHFPKASKRAKKAQDPLSPTEQAQRKAYAEAVNSCHLFANTPESAVNGLFVRTTPRLGVSRAESTR